MNELDRRYRSAVAAFYANPEIAKAAQTLGMSLREYCDRLVNAMGPVTFTTSGATTMEFSSPDESFAKAVADVVPRLAP